MLALFATQAQKCTTPKNNAFVDPDGRAIDPNDERNQQLITQRILKDGRIMLYRQTVEDARKFVQHLKDDGEKDSNRLNPDTWLQSSGCLITPYGMCKSIDGTNCPNCKPLPTAILPNGNSIKSCSCGPPV